MLAVVSAEEEGEAVQVGSEGVQAVVEAGLSQLVQSLAKVTR
jgi:hypothetical protein